MWGAWGARRRGFLLGQPGVGAAAMWPARDAGEGECRWSRLALGAPPTVNIGVAWRGRAEGSAALCPTSDDGGGVTAWDDRLWRRRVCTTHKVVVSHTCMTGQGRCGLV